MVIDDDLQILKAIGRILRPDCEVVAISDGDDALARLDSGETVDGILCDVNLRTMTGIEFQRTLSARDPQLASRLVFMTGGEAPSSIGAEMTIAKPFRGSELREAVHGLLTRPRTTI